MTESKFFSILSLFFGVIGLSCSIIIIVLLKLHQTKNIRFGNAPYVYFAILTIICFSLIISLRKKIDTKTLISQLGFLCGIVSLIPIIIFIFFLLFGVAIAPFLIFLS